MRLFVLPLCLSATITAVPAAAFERAPLPSESAMEPCPAQGSGFAKIPGTSTCIRLSGRVAAGADLGTSSTHPSPTTGRFQIDTRTPSEQGGMRTFVRIGNGR